MNSRNDVNRREFLRRTAVAGAVVGGAGLFGTQAARGADGQPNTPSLPYVNQTTSSLWVAMTGDDTGAGTETDPLRTIQEAVDRATPGTAIRVRAGFYEQSIWLDDLHGTPTAPIILISVDGIGEATISGTHETNFTPTVRGKRCSNIGVYGFGIQANVELPDPPDIGAFKFWSDYVSGDMNNLVLAGNYITGTGRDGVKLFGGAKNCLVAANTIDGTWTQEVMDNVGTEDNVFAYNTVLGQSTFTAITMKLGSRRIEIFGNKFDLDTGWRILIGGQGVSDCDETGVLGRVRSK